MGSWSLEAEQSSNMRTFACVLAFALVAGSMAQRGGRRRGGRQETGYAAPSESGYAAPDAQPAYGADQGQYLGSASDSGADDNLAMLEKAIPGVPGEDYPIYAEVPESGFLCDGQVDGGYYADPEAECQAFHICTADGAGGLAKYSFLCPNGTIFNQNYFICDWWFNFDCSTAEDLYSLNDQYAAERDALAPAASDAQADYAAPAAADAGYAAPAEYAAEGAGRRTGRQRSSGRNNRRGF